MHVDSPSLTLRAGPILFSLPSLLFLSFFSAMTTAAYAQYEFGADVLVNPSGGNPLCRDTCCPAQRNIAVRGDTIYTVWSDDRDGGSCDIFFARSINGGSSFESPIRVNQSNYGKQPSLAVDATGQYVFVVWRDDRHHDEAFWTIYFDRSIDGGATFGEDVRLDGPNSGFWYRARPSVAADGGSMVYVVWEDYYNYLSIVRSEDHGATFTDEYPVDLSPSDLPHAPALAAYPTGLVFLAFEDARMMEYTCVYAIASSDSGRTFENSVGVSGHGYGPAVGIDSQTGVHVVYSYLKDYPWGGQVHEIRHVRGSLFPLVFDSYTTVVDLGPDYGDATSLSLSSHQLAVTWGYQSNKVMFAWSDHEATSFSPPLQVNDCLSALVCCASVAITDNGTAHVMWTDTRGGQNDVYLDSGTLQTDVPPHTFDDPFRSAPRHLVLGPPHPNPIAFGATVSFSLPHSHGLHSVDLSLYDVHGRLVRTLLSDVQSAGIHEVYWDGTDQTGRSVPSGVYFCRLEALSQSRVVRMAVIR